MKLFDQTTYSDPKAGTHGDCFRAAIRTLAQQDMPDLPHPIGPDGWNYAFYDVLEDTYGLIVKHNVNRKGKDWSFLPRVVLATGLTERSDPETGQPKHSVVWDRIADRMIHDPHPSRAGLISITMFHWLALGETHD